MRRSRKRKEREDQTGKKQEQEKNGAVLKVLKGRVLKTKRIN